MRYQWLVPVLKLILLSGLWVNQPLFASEPPKVIVSIAPFHALVSAVMDGLGEPKLLLKGNASPHHYTLRPSEIKALQEAEIIFWGGPGLETFLVKPLKMLSPATLIVEFDKTKDLTLLKTRRSAFFASHDHRHEHPHEHSENNQDTHSTLPADLDMHFWLDPNNAKRMVDAIAEGLSEKDPTHQSQYFENAKRFKKKIEEVDHQIKKNIRVIQDRPFIVFHDAYQYFERHYGLMGVGAISLHPEVPPSIERLKAIRNLIKKTGAICIFSEPQFKSDIVESIVQETKVKTGQLDPLGQSSSEPGAGYLNLLRDLSDEMIPCLKP